MNEEMVKCKDCGHEWETKCSNPACSECGNRHVIWLSVVNRAANNQAKELLGKWNNDAFAALEAKCFEDQLLKAKEKK